MSSPASTLATPRPYVIAFGSHVLVSPNAPAITTLPSIDVNQHRFDDYATPRDATTLRCSLNLYPHLAYCLMWPLYREPLLQRLSCSRRTIPLEYIRTCWEMPKDLAYSWWSLEECLAAVANELLTWVRFPNYTGPPKNFGIMFFPKPSSFGYRRAFFNRAVCVRCCIRSRDAFIPLMALCSYAISLTPSFTDENPSWVQRLEERGIHPEWIQSLKASQLADFSNTNLRLGVIIRPKCEWLKDIPNMIRANVPLWFLWDDPKDFSDSLLIYNKYCPTRAEVQAAYLQQQGMANPPDMSGRSFPLAPAPTDAPLQPPPSNEQFPKPDPFSGQRRGETMEEFFVRRATRHVLMEQRESLAERTSRLDRERAAQDQHRPGRGASARCFTWEEVDGFMMRTYLVRGAIEDNWSTYGPSQRRYDSFYNEWDLATSFDPEASAEDDEDEDDDDDFMILRSDTPPPPPPYPPSPSPPHAIFTNDINTTYRNNISDGNQCLNEAGNMDINRAGREQLEDVLYWRFGFSWDGAPMTALAKPWIDIQKTLTDIESPVHERQRPAIATFVQHIVLKNAVPSALWDLNDANPFPLRGHFNPKLVVNPRMLNNIIHYFIQSAGPPLQNDPSWELVVDDPLTALECLRRDLGPSVVDVARLFLCTGRPFSTRICSNIHHIPAHPPRLRDPVSLGWRRLGYKGDSNDYAGYESRRTAFLAQSRGRKAVLAGGIVWRLAINSVELPHVLVGPSEDVFEYGDVIRSDSDGGLLWDDSLFEDELNLICGVYKVQTNANQTSDSSWWPKHAVWMTGRLNVGYWSVGCETWFQKRLMAIRDGTAHLKTSAEWRDSLKFWRATGPFIANSKQAAATFLRGEAIS